MSYITIDNINSINAELSNYCNADCPMCARYFIDGVLNKERVNSIHTTLNFLKDRIGEKLVRQLNRFTSCGNLGDGSMNPECLEIYQWLRQTNKNINLTLHTNGGARNSDFWRELAKIGVYVTFAIDGLEDTNHIYRVNVRWNKVIENSTAFIEAGGETEWQYIAFKHNEHQIDKAREFALSMGFSRFIGAFDSWGSS
jgi:MoaA/NifB/PqqE/SkfB family radical SAM enzyme